MPPLKPIPTLFETSLECYRRHCITSLISGVLVFKFDTRDGTENVSMIQRRESSLRSAKIYVQEYTSVHTRNRLIKLAIDEIIDCKYVSLSSCPQAVVPWKVLRDFLCIHGGEGIKELDFSYRKSRMNIPIETNHIGRILSQTVFQNPLWSKSLVSLQLPNLCNVEIIKAIGCCCPNLQYLDITSILLGVQCRKETFNCLEYLYQTVENVEAGCPKLKSIALPQWGGHPNVIEHVVKMLQFMPDLHVIRNVDTKLVTVMYWDIVGHLSAMKLKEFEMWSPVDEALCSLFPNVKRFAVYSGGNGISPLYHGEQLLKTLTNFHCLQILEVHEYVADLFRDINSMEPMPSVKVFRLRHNSIAIDEIQMISTKFTNLEKLILRSSCYVASTFDGNVNSLFSKLETLVLNQVAERIDIGFLKILLEKCPSVKSLDMLCADSAFSGIEAPITDDFVSQLSTSMKNLERVNIGQDLEVAQFEHGVGLSLTFKSVLRILSSCSNLRFLGDLKFWSIEEHLIHKVIKSIERNNWDLNFVNSLCEF